MTRKDFESVAQVLALVGFDNISKTKREKIDALLIAKNPRYDAEKFWQAVADFDKSEERALRVALYGK